MARLTITLSDEIYNALRLAAVRQGTSKGELVEDSLRAYGMKSEDMAAKLVARARRRSGLGEVEAVELAVDETRRSRRSRS